MDDLKKEIREVPDYPKPGIRFYDLTTLLKDKQGFHTLIDRLCAHYEGHQIDLVAVHRVRTSHQLEIAEMRRLAVECYQAVGCEGMARVDFLRETATGK